MNLELDGKLLAHGWKQALDMWLDPMSSKLYPREEARKIHKSRLADPDARERYLAGKRTAHRDTKNRRHKRQRDRLFGEQGGLCRHCKCPMLLAEGHLRDSPPSLCTLERLPGLRPVAACKKCSSERSNLRVKQLPLEELHARSGRKAPTRPLMELLKEFRDTTDEERAVELSRLIVRRITGTLLTKALGQSEGLS